MDVSILSPDMIDWIGWGPDILQLVQIEIQNRKMTYPQIAEKVHAANGTVASWFSRGSIPIDKIFGVVTAVGSAKLWMQVLAKLPGNAFHAQYLDKTDGSPLAATDDLMDGMEAAMKKAADYKRITRHKKSGFTEDEMSVINQFLDDCADVKLFSQMLLVRNEDSLGISAREVMDRQTVRMESLGYCSQTKKKSPVLAHRRLRET